jgi:hypothetical protein
MIHQAWRAHRSEALFACDLAARAWAARACARIDLWAQAKAHLPCCMRVC